MTTKLVRSLVVSVLVVVAAGCAVVPSYTASETTFEGFPVISFVPAHPVGLVFVFHGTGGSADFATKLETVDMLNQLTKAGYGFVATESTNRDTKQWNTSSLSLTANADLARLARLRSSLVTSGAITSTTPTFAIGMSRGAGFTSVFAQAFENAGYPVGAIAPSHGQIPLSVRTTSTGLTVPAFFALGANDPVVDNDNVIAQVANQKTRGILTECTIEPETDLTTARLLRVSGIDNAKANTIFSAFVGAGLWDADGHRLVSISEIESTLPTLANTANLTTDQKLAVQAEIGVVLATHQYSATYARQTVAFFDAHRSGS